jgi:hypothetical protein
MKVKINIEKEISRNTLENIFVTALEGGSNYWYAISSETKRAIREVVSREEDRYFSTALFTAVMDRDLAVDIHDAEDNETVLGTLTLDNIKDRLQKLADSDDAQHLMDELMETGDAITSDVCFQYMVMGEIIFG